MQSDHKYGRRAGECAQAAKVRAEKNGSKPRKGAKAKRKNAGGKEKLANNIAQDFPCKQLRCFSECATMYLLSKFNIVE